MCSDVYDNVEDFKVSACTKITKISISWEQNILEGKKFLHYTLGLQHGKK